MGVSRTIRNAPLKGGFTLIQVSIILTLAALAMVMMLPTTQKNLTAGSNSATKLNAVLVALRQYETTNGLLPCPADASQPIGSTNYGVAAANGGPTTNCTGGSPAANFVDATNHVAIGMVPVRTLGLSNDYALDNFGRDITYGVDTNATGCWASSPLTGQVIVTDQGTNTGTWSTNYTVAALVSHGPDGHGAWMPLPGSSGTAVRLNAGSTDTDQLVNAHLTSGFVVTASSLNASAESTTTTFVRKPPTSTFDDIVVYRNPAWNLNKLPTAGGGYLSMTTYPANGSYSSGQTWTFIITFPVKVTVTGTPRLDLSALGGGSNNLGTSNKAYANYASGSGTTALTFTYTIVGTDVDGSGIAVAAPIDLNNGTISSADLCFVPPNLSGVLIGAASPMQWWIDWFFR